MKTRLLSRKDIEGFFTMRLCMEAVEKAFADLAMGNATMPQRTPIAVPDQHGIALFMPAHIKSLGALGAKVVTVYKDNVARHNLPTVLGTIILLDEATGFPIALMEGGYLTAMRTGAVSGVATKYMARPEAKVAALFVAIAIALLLFAAILLPVGMALFLGEWLFWSIGWGVLHGTLLCVALVVTLLLGALEIPPRHLGISFAGALVLGIAVAVVLGLAWPHQLFAWVGDSLIPGVDTGVRPLVAGLALGALVLGVIGLLAGARAGGPGGAVAGLVGGAVLGALSGAFLAVSFSLRVGIALGICTMFIAWPAFAATALRSFDWEALKARYWPGTTIETTKETIEWVRARTPLGRKP